MSYVIALYVDIYIYLLTCLLTYICGVDIYRFCIFGAICIWQCKSPLFGISAYIDIQMGPILCDVPIALRPIVCAIQIAYLLTS